MFLLGLQILNFWQVEGLGQPHSKQVDWGHFSNSICSLQVSISHFGNSCNISKFSVLLYFLWWSVISDLRCYYCNSLGLHEPCLYKMTNFSNKCYMFPDCSANRLLPISLPFHRPLNSTTKSQAWRATPGPSALPRPSSPPSSTTNGSSKRQISSSDILEWLFTASEIMTRILNEYCPD